MANRMRRLVDPRAWSARERRAADRPDETEGASAGPLAVVARVAAAQAEATGIYTEAAAGMPDRESRAAVESAATARRQLAVRLAQEVGRGGAAGPAHPPLPLDRARPFASIVRGADAWETALAVHLVASVLDDATRLAAARLAARLSLWGRRLAGDALLFAWGCAALDAERTSAASPEVDTADLVSAHARRMDGLGLTA